MTTVVQRCNSHWDEIYCPAWIILMFDGHIRMGCPCIVDNIDYCTTWTLIMALNEFTKMTNWNAYQCCLNNVNRSNECRQTRVGVAMFTRSKYLKQCWIKRVLNLKLEFNGDLKDAAGERQNCQPRGKNVPLNLKRALFVMSWWLGAEGWNGIWSLSFEF